MPIDPTIIAAGIGTATTAGNAMLQGRTNRKTRKFSQDMYNQQRQHAVDDYEKINLYNSPKEQMKRLKEAGLNPNLVYGNGNATEAAAQIRSSDAPSWNPKAPEINLEAMSQFADVRFKGQQTNNAKILADNLFYEKLLKQAEILRTNAETENILTNTDTGKFNLDLQKTLRDINLQAHTLGVEKQRADIQKTQADTVFTLDENDRKAMSNDQSIRESVERVLRSQAERKELLPAQRDELRAKIRNLDKDTELKELDRKLKADGIQPHDPAWQRAVQKFLKGIGPGTFNMERDPKGKLKFKPPQQYQRRFGG